MAIFTGIPASCPCRIVEWTGEEIKADKRHLSASCQTALTTMKIIRLIIVACFLSAIFNCGELFRNADCSAKVLYTVRNHSTGDLEIEFKLDNFYLNDTNNTSLVFIPDTGKLITLRIDSSYSDSFHFYQPYDHGMSDCDIDYHLDNLVNMLVYKNGQKVKTFSVRPNSELSMHLYDDSSFVEHELNIFIDTLSISDEKL